MADQNGGDGPHRGPVSTAELKALMAQRKQDLQHAAPSLHPTGMATQPNNWEQMKAREDRIQYIQKRLHVHKQRFRNDFDMSQ